MSDDAKGNALWGIAALPPTTVCQIGSHQLLTDPSSVVKEMIDNALDARAKSIFVDITANTIDSIHVKDDGHGIPSEDRALVCRRYCTSKIRDFHDLKRIGGKWLGFRGEALASIADMSGTVSITTRVEGEPVAVKLTYQRNGELVSTERDSHPIGTTVKVTKLLESAKVRKELAIKGSAKCLAKIRRLMQAYALARPAVRFRLHVLKAKNNKGDFVYAPNTNANFEDAALKIIGNECALQCDWAALEMNGFELHAFLPKPSAVGSKVANHGVFISVDSRPVSSARGTLKKIATAVRDKYRKANSTLANVKDPFICLNIICPVDSYDPNIEPAKDDVIFGDENSIVALVDRLLVSYYPENTSSLAHIEGTATEGVMATQSTQIADVEEPLPRPHTPFSIHRNNSVEAIEPSSSAVQSQRPRWKSSTYGIDGEYQTFLQEDAPAAVEGEGRADAIISDTWTTARTNAPVKPKKPVSNGQLLSPAKSQSDASTAPPSPAPASTPHQTRLVEPLTLQTSSRTNVHNNRLDDELQRSIQHIPRPAPRDDHVPGHSSDPLPSHAPELLSFERRMSPGFVQPSPQPSVSDMSLLGSVVPRRNQKPRQPFNNKSFVPPAPQSDDTWFGQPMRNAPKAARRQKRPRQQEMPCFPDGDTFSSQRSLVLPAAERLIEARLTSENNTDIRDFFGQLRHAPPDIGSPALRKNSQPQHTADQLRAYVGQESPTRSSPCRPRSASSYHGSTNTAEEMDALFQFHKGTSPGPSSSPIRRTRPSDTASAPTHAPRPRRRRTTDSGLHRTKSSTLPLNFVPHGFETQNLSLVTSASVSSITYQARKLDMGANSLEWGYETADAFDVFAAPISERKIMEWVIKVDDMLHGIFESVDGVEVRGVLHEGIQRFLDMRNEEEDNSTIHAIITTDNHTSASIDQNNVSPYVDGKDGSPTCSLPRHDPGEVAQLDDRSSTFSAEPKDRRAAVGAATESDEYEENFDFSQFVDLNGDAGRQSSPMRMVKPEDDFGDGIDDEMLMDL